MKRLLSHDNSEKYQCFTKKSMYICILRKFSAKIDPRAVLMLLSMPSLAQRETCVKNDYVM